MNQKIMILLVSVLFGSCGLNEIENIPSNSCELKQNRPNPFIDTTLIEYVIPPLESSPPHIRICVYNRFHDRVTVLRDSISHPAGAFLIGWKPYNNHPSGMYYVELQQITGIFQKNVVLKRIATLKN
ncbi:MAG: hypothetical protein WDA22_14075 [Bacteroidota bacterium]